MRAAPAAVRETRKDAKPQATRQPSRKLAGAHENPYKRPFGRLSLDELEREIHATEAKVAECQARFGDAGSFKDPEATRKLQDDYDSLTKMLEALEAEYFARET